MSTSLVTPEEAASTPRAFAPHPKIGYLIYLIASFGFGINGTVSKLLLQAVKDTQAVAQIRITMTMLIFLTIAAVSNRRSFKVQRREWPVLIAYGVGGVMTTQFLYFIAIQRIPVGITLLIEFISPIVVVLWAKYVQHRRVTTWVWVGLTMGISGLALVGQVWQGLIFDQIGVLVAFCAMFVLAGYFILGEAGIKHRDPMSFNMWGFVAAGLTWMIIRPIWNFPWDKFTGSTHIDKLNLNVPLWALVIYMVLGGSVFAFWATVAAMRHIGAAGASIMGMLEPLIASIVAWLVMGEALTLIQIVGGGIMLGGVVIAERARSN